MHAAILQNVLNFRSRLQRLSVKNVQKTKKMSFALLGAPKNGRFFVRRADNVQTFLSVGGFCPPLEKCLQAPLPPPSRPVRAIPITCTRLSVVNYYRLQLVN